MTVLFLNLGGGAAELPNGAGAVFVEDAELGAEFDIGGIGVIVVVSIFGAVLEIEVILTAEVLLFALFGVVEGIVIVDIVVIDVIILPILLAPKKHLLLRREPLQSPLLHASSGSHGRFASPFAGAGAELAFVQLVFSDVVVEVDPICAPSLIPPLPRLPLRRRPPPPPDQPDPIANRHCPTHLRRHLVQVVDSVVGLPGDVLMALGENWLLCATRNWRLGLDFGFQWTQTVAKIS